MGNAVSDIAEVAVTRVKELKKTEKPPVGEYYYGDDLGNGFREVRLREVHENVGNATQIIDYVVWYEKAVKVGAEFCKVAYSVNGSPPIFPEYYYPAAQWNITVDRYLEQDNIPEWKAFPILDDNKQPVAFRGRQLRAYYYVIINHNFTVVRSPDGRSDNDGLFEPSDYVSGQYILDRINAVKTLGNDPVALARARMGD